MWRRAHSISLGCIALLTLLGAGTLAWAAPPGASLAKFNEGIHAFSTGHYEAALAAFQASFALEPSPNTRFKIARCYLALGQIGSAYTQFRRSAQDADDRLKATHEGRYAATRNAASAEAASLESRVPRLTLALASDVPADLKLILDGSEVPRAAWGLALEVDPGSHAVVVVGRRVQRGEHTVTLQAGERRRLDVQVHRLATASISLTYQGKPAGLAVYLDGQPLPADQLEARQYIDIGKHVIVATAPGHSRFSWKQTLADGEARRVTVALSPQTGTPKAAFVTVALATVAAVAAGVGFGVKARLADNEQQGLPVEDRSLMVREGIRTDGLTANIAFGVGGALGLTATILAFTTQWRSNESSKSTSPTGAFSIAPWTSSTAIGLTLSGVTP